MLLFSRRVNGTPYFSIIRDRKDVVKNFNKNFNKKKDQ